MFSLNNEMWWVVGGLLLHISVHTCFIEFYVQSFCNKQLVETSEMWFLKMCHSDWREQEALSQTAADLGGGGGMKSGGGSSGKSSTPQEAISARRAIKIKKIYRLFNLQPLRPF